MEDFELDQEKVVGNDLFPSESQFNPMVKDHISSLLMERAREQAAQNEKKSALTSALVQMGHALSRAPGEANLKGVELLAKNDRDPIKEAVALQASQDKANALRASLQAKKDIADQATETRKEIASLKGGSLKNRDIEALPAEDAATVKTLGVKNANKVAISNQIKSFMSGWDKLPDDQKIAQGRQLIKVLNSTEGADAVGSEEVKRLGGKLEFAMGNLLNSNPTQFGRDLEGFKDQALGTANAIDKAIVENQRVINKAYSGAGVYRPEPKAVPDYVSPRSVPVPMPSGEVKGEEIRRKTRDGRTAVYDSNQQFLRYE